MDLKDRLFAEEQRMDERGYGYDCDCGVGEGVVSMSACLLQCFSVKMRERECLCVD